ncbi:MAG: DNA recombination protein RmuC [Candidatus Paceibacterota bacterium]
MSDVSLIIIGVLSVAVLFLLFRIIKGGQGADTMNYLNQRLDNMNSSVNQALRDTVKMVAEQLKDSRESVERSSGAINKQVEGFTTGLTQLTENLKQVHETVKDVSSFQDIFKSPKLRGIWGEASLEASLAQYFPKDRYKLQHYFKSGEAVDAALRLPNELLLPVDSKFNWENFEKMVNADNDVSRAQYRKSFFSDVKKKIDEIASKYVLPSEGTTDFALMFVPAETVYYEIVNNIKDVDLPTYALSKKVFLVSPNTFMLSVSAIGHWLKDVQVSKQTREIMKRLAVIAKDGQKLADGFRKLGSHISNASSAYEDSEKRLGLMTNRVQGVIKIGVDEETPEIESSKTEE